MDSANVLQPVNGEWEVLKGAFAPPQTHTIRAWERAPVPAHAPRLQGQKIWKRAGLKTQKKEDKENFEAAQHELLREGTGARKRMRARRGKENIGDATWKVDAPIDESILSGLKKTAETEASTPKPLKDSDTNALQFVPRKRTNANHVIAPRKPMRQNTLNAQAQTQAVTVSQSPEKPRRRKSMRKSIRMSAVGIPDLTSSMKERSMVLGSGSDVSGPVVEENTTNGESASEVVHSESHQKTGEESKAESALNDKLNALFGFTDDEKIENRRLEPALSDDSSHLPTPASEPIAKVPLNDLAETNTVADEAKSPMDTDNDQEIRSRQDRENQSAILSSVEADSGASMSAQPTKTTRTPKKKRETSQRRGTRRSNRTTRASSVRPEEEASTGVNSVQLTIEEPTNLPIDTASNGVENPKEADAVVEGEATAEKGAATENEPVLEKDQASVPESILEREIYQPAEAPEALEASTEVSQGIDGFDVSAVPILGHSAIIEDQTATNDNFELPPPLENSALNTSYVKGQPESSVFKIETPVEESSTEDSSPVRFSRTVVESKVEGLTNTEDFAVEDLETLEPILVSNSAQSANENDTLSPPVEDLPETSTPDPTSSALVESISENASSTQYELDETDLLRNFVTRVKANKAAKAGTNVPKRKRSLPHSPLRLPLGEADTDISPSDQKMKDEFDVGLPDPLPSKRQKRSDSVAVDEDDTITEQKATRRSGRTRLPVIKTPLGAPSHIPVRRLGQDGDTTVTLRRNEEKELAALTRVNTRKNKGIALSVPELLAKKSEEKEDPVLRQRLLKEVFDDKAQKKVKKEKRKTVMWAEELTQYQTVEGRKADSDKEKEKEPQKTAPPEEKKGAVKVGIRSKIALGMAANGTPAPKRKRTRS